ncbi:glycosyltransferase family 2 protein [Patescibacteria group bacterium]
MKITVLIPAYNEEKYLPITLNSLKQLDRQPDEIIIIDGSSTDKTVEVAKQHGAKVITVEHKGIGYARQKGLEAASGDVVAYTDADTLVPKDWLSKIEESLSKPNVSCVFGTFRVPDGWFPYKFYVNYLQPGFNQIYFWFGVPMAPGQNTAFWRDKGIKAGGFPIDYKICEDIEMVRRLKGEGKIIFRQDIIVTSSGRRGNEGPEMFTRVFKAFFYYFIFRKANRIGFPDQR